jgi:peptidoglycan hydrolase-like protein with peptidoglycan-binding domain
MSRWIPRSEWGARPPKQVNTFSKSEGIFVHYIGPGGAPSGMEAEKAALRTAQKYHMDTKGWADIAYSFAVGNSGAIYDLRGWGVAGGHTQGWNTKSHAVFWIGGDEGIPSDAAFTSLNTVINEHNRRYPGGFVKGHGDVNATSCPGIHLKNWIKNGRPSKGVGAPPPAVQNTPGLPPTIQRGSVGSVVSDFQKAMANFGYDIKVDGGFGAATKAVAQQFQTDRGITSDGIVGPGTWLNIFGAVKEGWRKPSVAPVRENPTTMPTLGLGAKGPAVSDLQRRLVKVGQEIAIDGDFGPNTQKAVKNIQRWWNLTVDGVVGPRTWQKILWLESKK